MSSKRNAGRIDLEILNNGSVRVFDHWRQGEMKSGHPYPKY